MVFMHKWYLDGIVGLKASSKMALYFFMMINTYIAFENDQCKIPK